jgi:hypothetical protein
MDARRIGTDPAESWRGFPVMAIKLMLVGVYSCGHRGIPVQLLKLNRQRASSSPEITAPRRIDELENGSWLGTFP